VGLKIKNKHMKYFLKNNWEFFAFFLTFTIASTIVIYTTNKKSKTCHLTVFIQGQSPINAKNVNHYSNGFTSIDLCNGKTDVYYSGRIIKVVEK